MKNRKPKSSNEDTPAADESANTANLKKAIKLKRGASAAEKGGENATKLILIPVILVVAVIISWLYNNYLAGLVNKPLNEAKIIDPESYKSEENLDRYWGTYRYEKKFHTFPILKFFKLFIPCLDLICISVLKQDHQIL
jgi:hypothetical protein